MIYHKSVLLKESIQYLRVNPKGIYVDATFGGGGHSWEILKNLSSEGMLISIDKDDDVKANLNKFQYKNNFKFFNTDFINIQKILEKLNIEKVDGILADLGVSSHQINTEERGFSFRYDNRLDMRMNKNKTLDAYYIINFASLNVLTNIFRNYGELKNSSAIAKKIEYERRKQPIKTTSELIEIISEFSPKFNKNKFFAKVFQAIRIEVNKELINLKTFLEICKNIIKLNGRLVVISFHSLEDRIVKYFLRTGNFTNQYRKDHFGNIIRPFKPFKNFIKASEEEVAQNKRSRSAIMRIGTKINENL